jgi:hypothetical protein
MQPDKHLLLAKADGIDYAFGYCYLKRHLSTDGEKQMPIDKKNRSSCFN